MRIHLNRKDDRVEIELDTPNSGAPHGETIQLGDKARIEVDDAGYVTRVVIEAGVNALIEELVAEATGKADQTAAVAPKKPVRDGKRR